MSSPLNFIASLWAGAQSLKPEDGASLRSGVVDLPWQDELCCESPSAHLGVEGGSANSPEANLSQSNLPHSPGCTFKSLRIDSHHPRSYGGKSLAPTCFITHTLGLNTKCLSVLCVDTHLCNHWFTSRSKRLCSKSEWDHFISVRWHTFLFCVDAEINIWWKTIVYLCCSHFPVSVADESVFIKFISLGFRVFLFFFCKEKKYSAHRSHNYKIPSLCCMDLKVHGEWWREFVYLHWSIRCCVV